MTLRPILRPLCWFLGHECRCILIDFWRTPHKAKAEHRCRLCWKDLNLY